MARLLDEKNRPFSAKTSQVLGDLMIERMRQQEAKHYDAAHDDKHPDGYLADMAALIADPRGEPIRDPQQVYVKAACRVRDKWPRRHQLVIAAALIVAEIERMDRKTK